MIFCFYVISCDSSVSDSAWDSAVIDTSVLPEEHKYEIFWNSVEQNYATGMGMGDFDGDGDFDIVVSEGNDMNPGKLRVYHNHLKKRLPLKPVMHNIMVIWLWVMSTEIPYPMWWCQNFWDWIVLILQVA